MVLQGGIMIDPRGVALIGKVPSAEEIADQVGVSHRLIPSAILRIQLQRLAMRGLDATKAAKIVGCSAATARAIYSDPGFRKVVLGKINGALGGADSTFLDKKVSMLERLGEASEIAFESLMVMLNDVDTSKAHKIRIAQDFLNRNPETQAGLVHTHKKFDPARS